MEMLRESEYGPVGGLFSEGQGKTALRHSEGCVGLHSATLVVRNFWKLHVEKAEKEIFGLAGLSTLEITGYSSTGSTYEYLYRVSYSYSAYLRATCVQLDLLFTQFLLLSPERTADMLK